ncbi:MULTISPECIES: ABC transporter ATP-binding protein [unclassified Bacillus (in: firmicutes)]|uniref:ABC transporter ATP-binding protein n=1 Tax=unclassified Bacillus (in: firmicutes) TaxID=185979 RepID=UPI0008F223D1|nr:MULTISPECIES: ATP-binding cassette domain-containing protein [unclassified Bacillus (in: firmicutes)]SFB13524.1 energy-coupling factor transport system ATP-binding protein [Bacillus sp. UNCCL13]SFQ89998.1 energy-coupling factor transport system ATP-binding protein [Bacillus sp. cl95]
MEIIQLNNVSFTYPNSDKPALKDVSLKVNKGQFVVLCGPSGCGKSTMLRLLKEEIRPHGEFSGEIFVSTGEEGGAESRGNDVGFVFQDPENQIVSDDFLHEMVFGLENLGLPTNEMRSRVAEMVGFFGAESLLNRKTHELSGGKKQQMNLASVLLMQPDILLLDEPTAQLDPVSSRELLDMLVRLNEEFGMTIIMAEHRLEEVFTLADQIVMMKSGEIIHNGAPTEVIEEIWNTPRKVYVPTIPSLFLSVSPNDNLPLTVKAGRQQATKLEFYPKALKESCCGDEIMKAKDIYYRYNHDTEMVLNEMSFTLQKGEIYALLGGNGAGKSTFLKLMCGVWKPVKGKITLHNQPLKSYRKKELSRQIGYLPQNPKLFFIEDSVQKEIEMTMELWDVRDKVFVSKIVDELEIGHLLESHPYDLSGGELQKAALACILLRKPEILLLDEPTKGLDPISKGKLALILEQLRKEGTSILLSTHDVEFAAQYATRCGLIFQGKITAEAAPSDFFQGNFFYTTMIQRLLRGLPNQNVVTLKEAIERCKVKEF